MIKNNHKHSIYDLCHDCKSWGINMPENRKCGNCGSSDTTRYYPEDILSNPSQERALPIKHMVNLHCSQCGQSWDSTACGPTHAMIHNEILHGITGIKNTGQSIIEFIIKNNLISHDGRIFIWSSCAPEMIEAHIEELKTNDYQKPNYKSIKKPSQE